jgi:hypothetical protein
MAAESDSESSNLSATDWRKIRQLVDRAVNHKESRGTQRNRRVYHAINIALESYLLDCVVTE